MTVTAFLEITTPGGLRLQPLEGERVTVGRGSSNDVTLQDDQVSHVHAVLQCYVDTWAVRDLGSRNGTSVNGERIWAERSLRHGDRLLVGSTHLLYRADRSEGPRSKTQAVTSPPELTRREHDVLVALCSPLATGKLFTEPASIRQIAERLLVSEAAVKQHLSRLFVKFSIDEDTERRRVELANEAIRRGAVTLADLQPKPGP